MSAVRVLLAVASCALVLVSSAAEGESSVSGQLAYSVCQGRFCERGWIASWELGDQRARPLTPQPYRGEQRVDTNPAWSPSGNLLAFVRVSPSRSGLYVIGSDGKGLRRLLALDRRNALAASTNPLGWSPDGTSLVFDRYGGVECSASKPFRQRLTIVRVDGRAAIDVPVFPEGKTYRALESVGWSLDGARLIYLVYEAEKDAATGGCRFHRPNTQLSTIGADGLDPRVVVARSEMPGSVALSPDGNRFAYFDCANADVAGCDLSVVGTDGEHQQTLVSGDVPLPGSSSFEPSITWSANGRGLFVVIDSPGYRKPVALFSVNADTGRRRRVSLTTGEILGLTRDGHRLVLFGTALELVPTGGGAATTIGSPPVPKGASWSAADLYLR